MLSMVVPTYNERESMERLLPALQEVVRRLPCPLELIVVDDNSPDGTAEFVQEYSVRHPLHLRVVRRAGKFGLSSAVLEGWRAARGDYFGVMDADGSHDLGILPDLLEAVAEGPSELAVGSRYVPGGGTGDWPLNRRLISLLAIWMGRTVSSVRDLTSGYLVFRRQVLEGVALDPIGFKIGLEVMVRGRYRTYTEVPYVFTDRKAGTSKFGLKEIYSYLLQLLSLLVYRYRHPHQKRRPERVS